MAITKSIDNTIETIKDSGGTAHEINAAYLNGLSSGDYVTLTGAQSISGVKTFKAITYTDGIEDSNFIQTPVINIGGNVKIYFDETDGCIYYMF